MSAAGGLLVAGAGVWLGCQVFGGKALQRLGILGTFSADAAGASALPPKVAATIGPEGVKAQQQANDISAHMLFGPLAPLVTPLQNGIDSVAGSAGVKIGDLFGGIGRKIKSLF